MKKPTKGSRTITYTNGCHKTVPTYSYGIMLTEIGGNRLKAVRIDDQPSKLAAVKKVLEKNPGWRFKAVAYLNDRDFDEGSEDRI